jgi:hypothetical protein
MRPRRDHDDHRAADADGLHSAAVASELDESVELERW